ncbi:MAG: glycosyltransferase, partial [Cyanobacteria bacterium P01_D01_bin.36]
DLSQAGQVKNAYEMFGFSGHDLYNKMVKGGWTWLWPLKMWLNKWLVKLNYDVGVRAFESHWRKQKPDVVVSVMPLYNKGLWESLQRAYPGTPYVTVMTDFADCPPSFWFEPEIGTQWFCGTQRAIEQARSLDISTSRLTPSSGLVIHPQFYTHSSLSPAERAHQRQQLGLVADRPTAIVMFGGNGSQEMLKIAKQLEKFQDTLQLIFICGHAQALAEQLKAYAGPQKRAVVGFADNMANYMSLSDFFIGKPGNVSVSEALAMRLPIITACNFATMSQERYCAEWLLEQQVGIVVSSFQKVDKAVTQLLQPAVFEQYRANLHKFDNQAVFEVIDYLKTVLSKIEKIPVSANI